MSPFEPHPRPSSANDEGAERAPDSPAAAEQSNAERFAKLAQRSEAMQLKLARSGMPDVLRSFKKTYDALLSKLENSMEHRDNVLDDLEQLLRDYEEDQAKPKENQVTAEKQQKIQERMHVVWKKLREDWQTKLAAWKKMNDPIIEKVISGQPLNPAEEKLRRTTEQNPVYRAAVAAYTAFSEFDASSQTFAKMYRTGYFGSRFANRNEALDYMEEYMDTLEGKDSTPAAKPKTEPIVDPKEPAITSEEPAATPEPTSMEKPAAESVKEETPPLTDAPPSSPVPPPPAEKTPTTAEPATESAEMSPEAKRMEEWRAAIETTANSDQPGYNYNVSLKVTEILPNGNGVMEITLNDGGDEDRFASLTRYANQPQHGLSAVQDGRTITITVRNKEEHGYVGPKWVRGIIEPPEGETNKGNAFSTENEVEASAEKPTEAEADKREESGTETIEVNEANLLGAKEVEEAFKTAFPDFASRIKQNNGTNPPYAYLGIQGEGYGIIVNADKSGGRWIVQSTLTREWMTPQAMTKNQDVARDTDLVKVLEAMQAKPYEPEEETTKDSGTEPSPDAEEAPATPPEAVIPAEEPKDEEPTIDENSPETMTKESHSSVPHTIADALLQSEQFLGKGRTWIFPEAGKQLATQIPKLEAELPQLHDVLASAASQGNVAPVNDFLRKNGFSIQLTVPENPRGDEVYVASRLDVAGQWLSKGEETQIQLKDSERSVDAVKLIEFKHRLKFYTSPKHNYPIVEVPTFIPANVQYPGQLEGSFTVYMTRYDGAVPADSHGLMQIIDELSATKQAGNDGYNILQFPMVNYSKEGNIDEVKGAKTMGADRKPAVIAEARYQHILKMNELGMRAKGAAAMGMSRGVSMDKPYVIDGPFLYWIERDGVIPFAARITEEHMKRPQDLN